jgi:hypothetical protein
MESSHHGAAEVDGSPGNALATWSHRRRRPGRTMSFGLLGLKILLFASMLLVRPGRWVLVAWGLVVLADLGTLAWILIITWPLRTTWRHDGIWLRPNGGLRHRFIRWSNVRAYQIYPPDLVALDVQNSGEVRRRDREVVKLEFPEARLTEVEAIVVERVGPTPRPER